MIFESLFSERILLNILAPNYKHTQLTFLLPTFQNLPDISAMTAWNAAPLVRDFGFYKYFET